MLLVDEVESVELDELSELALVDVDELSPVVVDDDPESVDDVSLELALNSFSTDCSADSICCRIAAKLLLPPELLEFAAWALEPLVSAVAPLAESEAALQFADVPV